MDPVKEAFAKAKQDISELRLSIDSLKQEIEELKRTLSNQTNNTINTSFNSQNPTIKQQSTQSSTGNKGVPTNSQTVKQTIRQPSFEDVLGSIDSLKDMVKSQFISLTKQEMEVFSSIYLLEDQNFKVDYPLVAKQLGLSESSIRDYIHKMIRKGIPLIKRLEKNKKVYLSIDPNLKRVAPLSSLLLLRDK